MPMAVHYAALAQAGDLHACPRFAFSEEWR